MQIPKVCTTYYEGMWSPESIERCIDDQTFSPSYDFAPAPNPYPSTVRQATDGKMEKRDKLLQEGEGVGEEPNHMKARKPGSL